MQRTLIREIVIYVFKFGYNAAEVTKKTNVICERLRRSWSQLSNQLVKENSLGLQEPWRSGNVR